MNLKRHHFLYALLAVVLILGIILLLTPGTPVSAPIIVPSATSTQSSVQATTTQTVVALTDPVKPMQFEVVTTAAAQERGLGGRADIPENYGMLFVFQQAGSYGFWMKDMLAPIDMIWLDDDGTILKIDAAVAANTYPQAFYPPKPVHYVLEMRANEAARRGWVVGTKVALPTPYGK